MESEPRDHEQTNRGVTCVRNEPRNHVREQETNLPRYPERVNSLISYVSRNVLQAIINFAERVYNCVKPNCQYVHAPSAVRLKTSVYLTYVVLTRIFYHSNANKHCTTILVVFANFRKAIISFVLFICPSVRVKQTGLP